MKTEYVPCIRQQGFPGGSVVKNLPTIQEMQARSLGREGWKKNGNPFEYSCLENPIDRGDWQVTACGVAKSWTKLSD